MPMTPDVTTHQLARMPFRDPSHVPDPTATPATVFDTGHQLPAFVLTFRLLETALVIAVWVAKVDLLARDPRVCIR